MELEQPLSEGLPFPSVPVVCGLEGSEARKASNGFLCGTADFLPDTSRLKSITPRERPV